MDIVGISRKLMLASAVGNTLVTTLAFFYFVIKAIL